MPQKIHKRLVKQARKKRLKKGARKWGKYVYGTLKKLEKKGIK